MENFNTVPDKGTFGGSVEVINQNFWLVQQEMEMLDQGAGNIDKPYDPTKHSGLGRKTLKLGKNGSNVLTQEDFDTENTIYVIKYDFDLNGETVEIPEGCILLFEGGSVSGGKLVSNGTILNGTHRGNALYGIYLDSNKTPLSYNYNPIKVVDPSIEHGYTPKLMDNSRKRVTQSIVSFKHNNNKYLLTLYEEGGFFLFDEYYNLIKYFELEEGQLSHMNDGTVCGNDILIADCLRDSTGIRRVRIADIISVSNGGRVHSDKIGLCSNEIVYCIDYDNVRKEIAVCTESNGTSLKTFRMTDDGNYDYEVLQAINNLQSNFDSNVGKNTIQGIIFKNGVVLFDLWATQFDGYTPTAGIIPVIIDLRTIKAYTLAYPKLPFAECEIEGLCKDPDNDNVYWTIYHSWIKPDTSSSIIVKHSLDSYIKNAFNTKNSNIGAVGDGTYVNINLNSLGTKIGGTEENPIMSLDYKADGSAKYPFKTIDDAIIRGGLLGHHFRINIASGTYFIGSMTISTSYIHFLGFGDVNINGHLSLWNARATFSHINFTGSENNANDVITVGENSFLLLDNCYFNNTTGETINRAITCSDSDMEIDTCTFDKFDFGVRVTSSLITRFRNISVKDCEALIYVAGPSKILEGNVLDKITFIPNETTGTENIKILKADQSALGNSIIDISIYPFQYPALYDIIEKRFKENGGTIPNTTITGLLHLKVLGNGSVLCKDNKDGTYTYRVDSGELEENEFRINISRGDYYFNGYQFISTNGKGLLFDIANPNYTQLPHEEMTAGIMFFDELNNALNVRKSDSNWARFVHQGWARTYEGTLEQCRYPGLYYFAPKGEKPDLGGSSNWYYVLNIGRNEIVQIAFQNQGTKIGFRFGYQDSQNYKFTEWSVVNRENT